MFQFAPNIAQLMEDLMKNFVGFVLFMRHALSPPMHRVARTTDKGSEQKRTLCQGVRDSVLEPSPASSSASPPPPYALPLSKRY